MIRTLIAISAFAVVGFAGAANAAETQEYHISVAGKDLTTIRTEIDHATRLACSDVSVSDYAPCLTETYRDAMDQLAKLKLAKQ
jgi:hypothetical protein